MMQQLIRYGLVGLANTAFGLSLIYIAMSVFGFAPVVANAAGFTAAFLFSYWLNRRWTFRSDAHLGRSLTGFAAVCALGYALNLAAVLTAINFAQVNPYIAQLFGVAIYAGFVFVASKLFIFRT